MTATNSHTFFDVIHGASTAKRRPSIFSKVVAYHNVAHYAMIPFNKSARLFLFYEYFFFLQTIMAMRESIL